MAKFPRNYALLGALAVALIVVGVSLYFVFRKKSTAAGSIANDSDPAVPHTSADGVAVPLTMNVIVNMGLFDKCSSYVLLMNNTPNFANSGPVVCDATTDITVPSKDPTAQVGYTLRNTSPTMWAGWRTYTGTDKCFLLQNSDAYCVLSSVTTTGKLSADNQTSGTSADFYFIKASDNTYYILDNATNRYITAPDCGVTDRTVFLADSPSANAEWALYSNIKFTNA